MSEPDAQPVNQGGKIQDVLAEGKLSPLRKYALLTLGEWAPGRLVAHELLTLLFSGCPGLLGYFLRQKAYRPMFRSMGRGVAIGRHVVFRSASRIALGDGVSIDDNCVIDARGAGASIVFGEGVFIGRNSIVRCRGERIELGDYTDVGCNCLVATDSRLSVGRDVMIAAYTYISAGGSYKFADRTVSIRKQGFAPRGGCTIGDDVWLGSHTTVLDGTTIGRGAIIGSHSLVRESIPEWAVAFGAPAKVHRYR